MLAFLVSIASLALPGVVKGVDTAVNHRLARQGYNAAGQDAIGIVAFPQSRLVRAATTGIMGQGPLLPESLIMFGHTAVYVRVGGEIQLIRSYASESLVEAALNFGKIRRGTGSVPARIIDHLGEPFPPGGRMFDVTSGHSIEFPVPREAARKFMSQLPQSGPLRGALYTAQPEVAAQLGEARLGKGQNCVHWAVSEVESFLWTTVGPDGRSLKDLPQPDAARQGTTVSHIKQHGSAMLIRLPGGKVVRPVRGSMPVRLKLLKWGYRLFGASVLGYAAYRLWKARPYDRLQLFVQEIGNMVGGALGAKAAIRICHASRTASRRSGQLLCGLIGGALGSIGGASGGSFFGRWRARSARLSLSSSR